MLCHTVTDVVQISFYPSFRIYITIPEVYGVYFVTYLHSEETHQSLSDR